MQVENLAVVIAIVFFSFIVAFIASIFMDRKFWNWFLYGCAILPAALIHLFIIGVSDNMETRAPKIGSFIIFLLVCTVLYGVYRQLPNSFSFNLNG